VSSRYVKRATIIRQQPPPETAEGAGLRLGLWVLLVMAVGAAAAYALKRRHNINMFERKFDPDAELAASRIPYVEQEPRH
jgi:hypothetical protein